MAWCSGMHIVFYDVVEKTEDLHSFSNHSQGEGVCCLSGHPTLPLFAFAEKVSNPRVLVYTYPSMKQLSECLKGGPSGYLATAFTEHEHLVTLASYPYFPLTIWSWRTGDRLATVPTHIRDINSQMITTTYSGPTMIAQLGKESGKLTIWQMRMYGKMVSLRSKDIKLPRGEHVTAAIWSPEPGPPTLGILDKDSHLYILSHEATVPTRIAQTLRCSECAEIEVSDICWYRGGLVLKTTFCQIRYYKKLSGEGPRWSKIWMVKVSTHPWLLVSHPFRSDRLFYHTREGHLMQLEVPDDFDSMTQPGTVAHLCRGSFYRFIDWIYPWGHHLTVIDKAKELSILETDTGQEVSRVNLEISGYVSCLVSRSDMPLLALTSSSGEFVLLGICDPEKPLTLAQFHLHRDDLDLLKLSYSGDHVAAGFSLAGIIFCISSKVGAQFEVIARVDANRQISDVLLYDTLGHLKLFALCVTSKHAVIGNQILVYDLPNGETRFSAATHVVELLNSFHNLQYSPFDQHQVLGSPYLTRQVQVLGIHASKEVTLLEMEPSDHQLRQVTIFTDHRWITTCSRDGIVAIRKKNKLRTRVAMITPHHRKDRGAVKAIMKPSGDVIMSLGYDGSVVCTKLVDDTDPQDPSFTDLVGVAAKESEWRKSVLKNDYAVLDDSLVTALSQPTVYFAPLTERTDRTWVEWKRSRRIAQETKQHAMTRASIQNSFVALKSIVTQLMNANESCPEIEQLPLAVFDLDKVSRDQKLKAARDAREDVRCELEWNCAGMDHVSDWVKKSCWDKQQVQGQSINEIFGRFKVVNYPTIAADPLEASLLSWAQFSKQFVDDLADANAIFHPWTGNSSVVSVEPLPKVRRDTTLSVLDEKQRIDAILDEDEEDVVVDEAALENHRSLEGMTTYRFIESSRYYYSQFELYSYVQIMTDRQMISNDVQRLQAYFNKLFNDIHALKEREMSLVVERNDRIRYINEELKLLFNKTISEIPIDPIWDQAETPESLVKVLDSEVKVPPYISPSTQEILDKQAAEANRLRLLLLADDFRERALMAMMDGVLEVRWEDLIKKDVPKPRCMLTKKPDAYVAEDILMVQQYEKEVEALMNERDKYKRILEVDYLKVNAAQKDGIERFRQRLEEFFATRVRVDSAIHQLRLRYWRGCYRDMRRQQMYESEEKLKNMISEKEGEVITLSEEVRRQQSTIADLRGHLEAASNREKLQEKKFRSEFPSLAKATQDLLMRQYKRRPRKIQKVLPSTYLIEIGKAAANTKKPFYLTGECVEYLKNLDYLDVRPTTLPPFIDASHWDHLVRLRRHRVEIEMRVKSVFLDIAEAEHTVMEFNKLIASAKAEIEILVEKLNAVRLARVHFDQDIEVQLVLKMGRIEVDLRTDGETAKSIFLPWIEIGNINWVILVGGIAKLKALKRMVNFRRGITSKEWEHKMLKMRIEDLREEFYCVERVTVSKEVQDYLKRKAKGLKEDKTQQQLERELEMLRRSWEKQLIHWSEKLEAVESRINAIKKTNSILDKKITIMNVGRCEMELRKDSVAEAKTVEYYQNKMDIFVERSRLVRKLQDNYSELLILQTEYELLRLRRFPAFNFFKTLDHNC